MSGESNNPSPVLRLSLNEASEPAVSDELLLDALRACHVSRYPDTRDLSSLLAGQVGVGSDQVLVTAGGDDLLDRVCRTFVGPERTLVAPTPTFSMLGKYAALSGGAFVGVPWGATPFDPAPLPVDALVTAAERTGGMIAFVSPNNPTGQFAKTSDMLHLVDLAADRGITVLADLAYVEFAEADLTDELLQRDNVIVLRTLSKAWGLAGLRIGYGVSTPSTIERLRNAGGPFTVSSLSVSIAEAVIRLGRDPMKQRVAEVLSNRSSLAIAMENVGFECVASEANFILARHARMQDPAQSLLERGVQTRSFPNEPSLTGAVRVTVPHDSQELKQLLAIINTMNETPS